MKKTYITIIIILTTIISIRYIYLTTYKHDYYTNLYLSKTQRVVNGINSPRGRILDRNGKVLVDNIGINTIVYRHISGINTYEISTILNNIIEVEPASLDTQKEYYLKYEDTSSILTIEEQDLYERRKLTLEEVERIKLSRINPTYTPEQQKIITIHNLLNDGYYYDYKVIKEDVSDTICAQINTKNIPGLTCEYTTKRTYLYDTSNSIYGTVGNITKENKEYYLSEGYNLNDKVGLSYLEKEYDKYLKGTPAKYLINEDNSLTKIQDSIPGNDIYLSIDIDIQLKIAKIIKDNIAKSENLKNTEYFNSAYVIVSDPNTGEIISNNALMKVKDKYYDISTNLITNSFTVGSVVKGASHTVGYQNNIIDNFKRNDICIKLYQVPEKCSYKYNGYIDDIKALRTSSNSYQFQTVIKLVGQKYRYNMKLNVTEEHFNIYRNTFASFGLGSSTGIDLPNESTGIKGNIVSADLLLNYSIGQYDTYTPMQLTNYINTIATKGNRYSLHYLKEVKSNQETIYTYNPKLLNKVESNFDRINKGFQEVLLGTGYGYTNLTYKPAGKTGTSQVIYNKDITTINQSYVMYAPYDNPRYTIVVITPNVSYEQAKTSYTAPINRYISKEVTKLLFEK